MCAAVWEYETASTRPAKFENPMGVGGYTMPLDLSQNPAHVSMHAIVPLYFAAHELVDKQDPVPQVSPVEIAPPQHATPFVGEGSKGWVDSP